MAIPAQKSDEGHMQRNRSEPEGGKTAHNKQPQHVLSGDWQCNQEKATGGSGCNCEAECK
jgi:hypothetical protein